MPSKSIEKHVANETATATNERLVVAGVAATVKKEPKYKIEKLRAGSMKLFKVTTSTFDGAMHGHEESEMTIAEAGAIIDKWLGRKE